MTEPAHTVVPNNSPRTEEEYHAAMVQCISRQVGKHGKGRVAQVMGLSIRQLDNIMAGSFPRPDRLANLSTLSPDALDPIDRLYGTRSVPRNSVCSTDPVSTSLARLLSRTIPMECPNGEGGVGVTMSELLALGEDETHLRDIQLQLNGWVERIDAYRGGAVTKLKVA